MKLMCINNESLEQGEIAPLTIGKIYESLKLNKSVFSSRDYLITHDDGTKSWEYKKNFIPLEQWRDKQLEKLL